MNVGDFVKFKNGHFDGFKEVSEEKYNKHGDTSLTQEYHDRGCELIAKVDGVWVVKAPTTSKIDDNRHIKGYTQLGFSEELLVLFKSNKNNINMNIKEKFALAFKSEPEKTFRKAGITNGDDFLTDDGQKIFLSYLLKKHGVDFKKEVVDELVKEGEDKK